MVRLPWSGPGQEMGIIGFRGDATTAQPRDVLAADTLPAATLPPARSLAGSVRGRAPIGQPRAVRAARRGRGGAAVPRSPGSCCTARPDNERNSDQSSAAPRDCDTELLRVRKISVLCFSLQKRTTKIGQKKAGWQLSQSGLCGGRVNQQAGIIRNNRDCPPPWCTPSPSVATHSKVGHPPRRTTAQRCCELQYLFCLGCFTLL